MTAHEGFGEQQIVVEEMALEECAPSVGKTGQTTLKSSLVASSSAFATGPILPRLAGKKVERYWKKICFALRPWSHRGAATDCSIADFAGPVRVVKEITTTLASCRRMIFSGHAHFLNRAHAPAE